MKTLAPVNKNGNAHGYWETYFSNGDINFKANYIDGKRYGYWESYWDNGNLYLKGNFVNEIECGYWERYSPTFNIKKTLYYAK